MKSAKRYCCLVVYLFCMHAAFAQHPEANIWYFGEFLGLDFNSGTAVPLNDGRINTREGVATISDANGRLLFYTDGSTIWNRNHQVMPNGTGLYGNFSATQSAVIVPQIGDPSRYFVFTVDAVGGTRGLNYSVVNMSLAGGNGDVEVKNVPLQSNVVEKITAIRHCNNRDVWVLAHGSGSDIYYAYLVTAAGVAAAPVISHTGIVVPLTQLAYIGCMKASPDGSKIAAAHMTVSVDVSDFDNATGLVSNTNNLFLPSEDYYWAYGVEFSPDSRLLYTSLYYTDPVNAQKRNALFQYDVTLPTPAAISASKQVIYSNSDPTQTFGSLQIGPDGKMYFARYLYKSISCINSPNTFGTGCGFVLNAITFTQNNQQSSYGLPTFIQSYFYPIDSFSSRTSCPGATFEFSYTPSPKVLSVLWNFNDPGSGANNTSTQVNPAHLFSAPGNYTIELVKFTNCGPDTIRKNIVVDTLNNNLGPDINQCGTGAIVLNPSTVASTNTYLWQDGSTGSSFLATTPGLYWLEVKNASGCVKRDSINVQFKTLPAFDLGPDAPICQNDTLRLNATVSDAISYTWNTGATSSTIKAFQPGLYWCEVSNGCIFRDSMTITGTKPSPTVNLGNDQSLCEGIPVTLDATYPASTYLWQDGSSAPMLTINQQGLYHVAVDLNGCKAFDTVRVNYILKPRFTLGEDQFICPSNTITLSPALDPSWQLIWQDGSTATNFIVTQPGLYSLSATNNCGSTQDDMTVSKGVCKVYVPTAFTPNNDGRNDVFKALGTETISKLSLKVFNRWGEVVFETTDKTRGWDGKVNGKLVDSGVFIYTLSFTDINDPEPKFLKGTLVLVR